MKERLQKIIAACGITSRRKAEEWIVAGRVSCNGIIAQLGDSADPETDEILLDGKPLPSGSEYMYIMLNKPRGFVTTLSDEQGRRNAAQLVADCGTRVYPVGRLDMDSEGLLLFTNDGNFANAMMHPKHNVDKVYEVWVSGYTKEAPEKLRRPIVLDGYRIHPPKVRIVWEKETTACLHITIHEGRNRQVRRMCQAAGVHVNRLKRIAEGSLRLGDLKTGMWRFLTEQEKMALQKNMHDAE